MTEKQILDNSKEFTKIPLQTTVFAVLMGILVIIKTLNLVDMFKKEGAVLMTTPF